MHDFKRVPEGWRIASPTMQKTSGRAKEDRSRLTGRTGAISSRNCLRMCLGRGRLAQAGPVAAVNPASGTPENLRVRARQQVFSPESNDYGCYDAISPRPMAAAGTRFVKIRLKGGVQIGRVEVKYGRPAALVALSMYSTCILLATDEHRWRSVLQNRLDGSRDPSYIRVHLWQRSRIKIAPQRHQFNIQKEPHEESCCSALSRSSPHSRVLNSESGFFPLRMLPGSDRPLANRWRNLSIGIS